MDPSRHIIDSLLISSSALWAYGVQCEKTQVDVIGIYSGVSANFRNRLGVSFQDGCHDYSGPSVSIVELGTDEVDI